MANKRLALNAELEKILGNKNVYFQPPDGTQMNYPAIAYDLTNIDNSNADNVVYMQKVYYKIIVIETEAYSEIVEKISKLPTAKFNTSYYSSGLSHTVFTIQY